MLRMGGPGIAHGQGMITVSDRDWRRAEKASEFFKALAHPSRVLLLCALNERPQTVSELRDRLGASQADVSQHLIRLRYAGLVTFRRDGRYSTYRLSDAAPLPLIAALGPESASEEDRYASCQSVTATRATAEACLRDLLAGIGMARAAGAG